MSLLHELPDWEKRQLRMQAFWERSVLDRVVIQVSAPLRPAPKGGWRILLEAAWADPESVIDEVLQSFSATYFAGDAFPLWYPNLGPTTLSAMLGCPIHFSFEQDTSWQDPCLDSLESSHLVWHEDNPIWQATLRMMRAVSEAAPGRFVTGMPDLGMGADVLAFLRGPQAFCLDLLECPEAVQRWLRDIRERWVSCYQQCYRQIPDGKTCCWLPMLAAGTTYPLQNDFSCMVSPQLYRTLFLNDLLEHVQWLDYPIYHLDGPGAVCHLEMLLEIPSLKAIQWSPGDGQPPMTAWVPMLQRIQQAGKGLFLYVREQEVEPLLRELSPEGLALHTWAETPEDADRLVQATARWTVA